jgi:hypothetical protein
MAPIDRLAAWLRPEDVEPALRLLSLFEQHGRIDPSEAEERRRRITAWARFNEEGAETQPSA